MLSSGGNRRSYFCSLLEGGRGTKHLSSATNQSEHLMMMHLLLDVFVQNVQAQIETRGYVLAVGSAAVLCSLWPLDGTVTLYRLAPPSDDRPPSVGRGGRRIFIYSNPQTVNIKSWSHLVHAGQNSLTLNCSAVSSVGFRYVDAVLPATRYRLH